MHNGERAIFRLGIGVGLSALVGYGLALPMPHLGCIMAWLVLCRPAGALTLKQATVAGVILMTLLASGVLLVPLLTHYALLAILLNTLLLYALMRKMLAGKGASVILIIMAVSVIPVAGLIDQSLAISIAQMMGIGVISGALVNLLAYALFPPQPVEGRGAPAAAAEPENPKRLAIRAVAMMMPVWLMALINPPMFLPAIMKSVTLAQQSTSLAAREAGKSLILSTLMGSLLAFVLWMALSVWPSLLMLVLLLMLMTLGVGRRMFLPGRSRFSPSFWSNAWITALILVGPAIEDSATGKDVWLAAAMRCGLYLLLAVYGWLLILIFERWRPVGRPLAEPLAGA